ncbi:MAG: DUF3102 domain-containing protein [Gemmata sp.]
MRYMQLAKVDTVSTLEDAWAVITGRADEPDEVLAAKEMCGHGNWLSWLKAYVPFSQQHACRYMALAKTNTVSDLEGAWRVITGRADKPDEVLAGARVSGHRFCSAWGSMVTSL